MGESGCVLKVAFMDQVVPGALSGVGIAGMRQFRYDKTREKIPSPFPVQAVTKGIKSSGLRAGKKNTSLAHMEIALNLAGGVIRIRKVNNA